MVGNVVEHEEPHRCFLSKNICRSFEQCVNVESKDREMEYMYLWKLTDSQIFSLSHVSFMPK